MAEYEVVREILNQCANNQMRDVFIDEIETDDPEAYVRGLLRARPIDELTREELSDGSLTLFVRCSGLSQRFTFTEL